MGACNRTLQRIRGFRPRIREANQSHVFDSPVLGEGRSPNGPAIGEQQMDLKESATILALPAAEGQSDEVEESEGMQELPGAA
jgi:hypothetical protein